jgi:hypothetical protein
MTARRLIRQLTTQLAEARKINWNPTGIGGTPNQQTIDYFGFVRWMTPVEFRRLVPPGNSHPDSAGFVAGKMRQGAAIAPPFLQLDWVEAASAWQVVDHEGRSRADAAMEVDPASLLPVHLFPRGMRARHLTKAMIDAPLLPQRWTD